MAGTAEASLHFTYLVSVCQVFALCDVQLHSWLQFAASVPFLCPGSCLKAHFLVRELFQESLPFLLLVFFPFWPARRQLWVLSCEVCRREGGIFTAGLLQEQCQAVRWGWKHWCKPDLSPENWISSWHLPQCSQPKQTHSSGAEGIPTFIHLLPVCSICALWWSFTPYSALTWNRG